MSSGWLLLSFSCRSRRTIDLFAIQQRGRSAGLGGLSRTVRCYPAVPPLICRCYSLPVFRQKACSFKRLDVLPAIFPLVTAAARRCGRLAHRRHDASGAGAEPVCFGVIRPETRGVVYAMHRRDYKWRGAVYTAATARRAYVPASWAGIAGLEAREGKDARSMAAPGVHRTPSATGRWRHVADAGDQSRG